VSSFRFVCELPAGLHARPASVLAETARRYHSAAMITNLATGASAELRSVLSIIGLDVQRGHEAEVAAQGDDAEQLIERVRMLVAQRFGETDGGGEAAVEQGVFVPRVPAPLRRANVVTIAGVPVCPGVGQGVVVMVGGNALPAEIAGGAVGTPAQELVRLNGAIGRVRETIEEQLRAARHGPEREILGAHLGIIVDPALAQCMAAYIGEGKGAPRSVLLAAKKFAAQLGASASAYIRERAADVREVCRRLLAELCPTELAEKKVELTGPSIVVAESLGVGQLTGLDRKHVRGLVLGDVGRTSHLVIIARSLQIPTLIGVELGGAKIGAGEQAIVDAIGGFVVPGPPSHAIDYYARDERHRARRQEKLAPLLCKRGTMRDGQGLEVAANAATPPEIRAAMDAGADSIGLLRTELLFLDRATPPTEEEQYELYRGAADAARKKDGREVIIRTLDIGGDKPAPYISIPEEENPFLGCRGVRLYLKYPDLLRAQLRAICRASAHGPIKVMAPMVATVGEAKWFCDRIARVQGELSEEGIDHDPNMPVGIMVEVPSVALIMDQLAHVVDFISIGTNDLCQYTFAADRGNPAVAGLNNPREPSFLRLLERIVSEAAAHGVWAGICGEMAGDPRHVPLMAGLAAVGLDEISVAAPSIGPIKAKLAELESGACRELLKKAMACETAAQVEALLEEFAAGSGAEAGAAKVEQGPLHADLIMLDSDATTKEQIIQELVGALHAAGRTDDPRAVEEAVWAREAEYLTDTVGHGFAIPHCKSDAVAHPSISVAKLLRPIDWGSAEGEPVRVVIMLTSRKTGSEKVHMQMLAKLARRLMHEGFREALVGATDAEALLVVLETELELKRS
jgi:multiphosphoryl transfer protein